MLVDASPKGPGASGSRLSNSTTALLLASRPVTTLRMSDAMAVEHVSASATAGQNVIFSINSSPVCSASMPLLNVTPRHSTMPPRVRSAARCIHGARSHRFLSHFGKHLFVSQRDAACRGGAFERHPLPLAAVSSARDPAGDETRTLRRQAGEAVLYVARRRASRRHV